MAGQIIVSFVGLPLLGIGSDWLVRTLAKRNGGVHQPQYRLVPLVLPVIVGTLSAIIYGQAAAHPERFHWFAIVFTINAYYFAFVGANQVSSNLPYLFSSWHPFQVYLYANHQCVRSGSVASYTL